MSWYVAQPDPPSGDLQAVRENVAGSFADLAEPIAEAWAAHWPPLADDDTPHHVDAELGTPSYSFRLSISYKEDAEGRTLLDKLTVALEPGQDGPGPTRAWPDAYCRLADGGFLKLQPLPNGQRQLVYAVPEPVPAGDWPVIRLEWPGLNIASIEDGRARLSVQRNERLVPDVPTSRAFVFTTATIKAPDVAVPLNQWVADFALETADLGSALQKAFGEMFGSATGMPLTVGVSYGYQLVPPGPGGEEEGDLARRDLAAAHHQAGFAANVQEDGEELHRPMIDSIGKVHAPVSHPVARGAPGRRAPRRAAVEDPRRSPGARWRSRAGRWASRGSRRGRFRASRHSLPEPCCSPARRRKRISSPPPRRSSASSASAPRRCSAAASRRSPRRSAPTARAA
jgi:hypothetical protein